MVSRARQAEDRGDVLAAEAKALGIDLAEIAGNDVAAAIKAEKERRWRIENADAIRVANEYIEKHGLPFAEYRRF
ncbi:MAG: post-segregation antitoxin CcdA [Rhizobium sp. 63-7]|nr:MAG: post-segregation antitoxin CcdA [Rhizobium sp. 63-7]